MRAIRLHMVVCAHIGTTWQEFMHVQHPIRTVGTLPNNAALQALVRQFATEQALCGAVTRSLAKLAQQHKIKLMSALATSHHQIQASA